MAGVKKVSELIELFVKAKQVHSLLSCRWNPFKPAYHDDPSALEPSYLYQVCRRGTQLLCQVKKIAWDFVAENGVCSYLSTVQLPVDSLTGREDYELAYNLNMTALHWYHDPPGFDVQTHWWLGTWGKTLDEYGGKVSSGNRWTDFCETLVVGKDDYYSDNPPEKTKQWQSQERAEIAKDFVSRSYQLIRDVRDELEKELLALNAGQHPQARLALAQYYLKEVRREFLWGATAIGPYLPIDKDCWSWSTKMQDVELGLRPGILKVNIGTPAPASIDCEFIANNERSVKWTAYEEDFGDYASLVFITWSYANGEAHSLSGAKNIAHWFIEDVSGPSGYAERAQDILLLLALKADFERLVDKVTKVARNNQPYWMPGKVQWCYIRNLDEVIRELEYTQKIYELRGNMEARKKHILKSRKRKEQSDKILLIGALCELHGIGTDKIKYEPVSSTEIEEKLRWSQPKISREMKKLFGDNPMQKYKQCFKGEHLTGFMKKLEDGSYGVDGIVEPDQE